MQRNRLSPAAIRSGLILALCAWVSGPLKAADASPEVEAARAKGLAEACARSTCRTQTRELQFKLDGGTLSMQTELLPYADEGNILLYPGDTIEFDFAADGKSMDAPHFSRLVDHLEDPKLGNGALVSAIPRADSRANFSFQFAQNGTGMTLKVKSDIGYHVKYDAIMFVPEKDGLKQSYTSSCPVIPFGSAYETWPHPIAMIVLTGFRVVADGDFTCK